MPEQAHALVRLGIGVLALASVGSMAAGDCATALVCFYFAAHVLILVAEGPLEMRRFLHRNGWLNVACAGVAVLCSLWAQAALYAAAGTGLLILYRPRSQS